jgi:predicted AAA+ superfamily ATPase
MNDADIATLLRRQNPWWTKAMWFQDDPDLGTARGLPLDYAPAPLTGISAPGLYVLRGPRRVGKSLELKRAVSQLADTGVQLRQIIFCACDNLRAQDLRRIFAVGRNLTRTMDGPRYWLLDEVTAVEGGWSAVVKHVRDQTAVKEDCVVLTGSSARDLHEARKDLAGRHGNVADSDRLLLPMGFRAFCHALGDVRLPDVPSIRPADLMTKAAADAVAEMAFWQDDLHHAWELYLDVGGFPRAVAAFRRSGEVEASFVQDLWHVASGEAIRRAALSDRQFVAFLDRLARNLGSPLNLTTIARDVGLGSHHRVSDRLNDLVLAFLMWSCYQDREGTANPAAQRKAYFVDPLVATLASRIDGNRLAPDHSQLTEQQLANALLRAVAHDAESLVEGGAVMYERTPTGNEIDAVGPALGTAFESKYVDEGWRREARTLASRHGRGVVATRGALDTDGDVWAVPVSILASLLPA